MGSVLGWGGGRGKDSGGFLTRRPVGRRRSSALVGRVDVEDLDPSRRPVVDQEVLRGA